METFRAALFVMAAAFILRGLALLHPALFDFGVGVLIGAVCLLLPVRSDR